MMILVAIVTLYFSCTLGEGPEAQVVVQRKPIVEAAVFKGYATHLLKDGDEVGFLYYVKLPLMPCYILYNLYIHSTWRKQGYSRLCIAEVCEQIRKNPGTKLLLAQPGPFELSEGLCTLSPHEGKEKLNWLVPFYQSYGLRKINSRLTVNFLRLVYRLCGIPEDPGLLMYIVIKS